MHRDRSRFDFSMLGIVFALAWPTMLEQLTQTAVQYIDTAMVGVLGTEATAAVGATGTVNWMVGSTVSAIGVGFLSFIAQSIGAGKREQARKASAQAVMVTVLLGDSPGPHPSGEQLNESDVGFADSLGVVVASVTVARTGTFRLTEPESRRM